MDDKYIKECRDKLRMGVDPASGKDETIIAVLKPGTILCADKNPSVPIAIIIDEVEVDKNTITNAIEKAMIGECTTFTDKKPTLTVEEIISLYDEMKKISEIQQQREQDIRMWLRSYLKHIRKNGVWASDFVKELGCNGFLLHAFLYMGARLNDTLINALSRYFQDQMRNGAITPVVEFDSDKPTVVIERKE